MVDNAAMVFASVLYHSQEAHVEKVSFGRVLFHWSTGTALCDCCCPVLPLVL